MNCVDCQNLLQHQLDDNDRMQPPELQLHLNRCAECKQLFEAALVLECGLKLLPQSRPPAILTERIYGCLVNESRRKRRMVRAVQLTAALAAGVLLAIVGMPFIGQRQHGGAVSTSSLNSNGSSASQARPTPSAVASVNQSIEEAGLAISSLVSSTADETFKSGRMLLPDTVPTPDVSVADIWPPSFDPPTQTLREAGSGIAAGFEPVASSARRAVQMFLLELPPMDNSPQ